MYPVAMIRTLTPADVQEYRILRLVALQEQPPAFGIPATKEERQSIESVAARIRDNQTDRARISGLEG